MWRAPLVSLLFTSTLFASGCQIIIGIEDLRQGPDAGAGPDARPGDDAAPAPDAPPAPGFDLDVRTVDPTLPLDGKNVIEVEIRRHGGFTGDVTITAPNPPVGVVVTQLVIPADQTAARVEVGAIGPLQIGDVVSFDLAATGGDDLATSAPVNDAEVTGKPGSFDVAFGAQQTGYATVGLGSDDAGAFNDIEVLPDGSFLAAGSSTGGLGAGFMILGRFTAEGLFDATFNGGALVHVNFQTGSSNEACDIQAVGRQVNGSILGIGWSAGGMNFPPDIGIIQRAASGGAGSNVFGNLGGKSRVNLGGDETVSDGLVLPDSEILAVGQTNGRLFVARMDTLGTLDVSFGSNGFQSIDVAPTSGAEAVTLDASGRILVAGFVDDGARAMVVVRFTADGLLDTTFGQGGVVAVRDPDGNSRAAAIAVRPNGRVVVAGEAPGKSGSLEVEVHQFLEDGTPDLSFGVQGVATVASTGDDTVEDMALLPDGRVLLAVTNGGPFLVRLMRDGTLDPYFSPDGLVPVYLGDSGVVRGLEVVSRAKVLIAGGNQGGTPGPGTFGVVVRMWM
jgi:uncharacterized delta-60 repeat protein